MNKKELVNQSTSIEYEADALASLAHLGIREVGNIIQTGKDPIERLYDVNNLLKLILDKSLIIEECSVDLGNNLNGSTEKKAGVNANE
ncbi:hypothetical protein M3M38_02005 [Fructilactobacillus cliffordii]|uniref:hypothetical protein n=1 Tax=Fructilactobacillus cliffordii TaxID=2940299 RepID=UPI002093ADB6|nr:hypothetical protein [Fructilactobacillus cliffordii]USS86860.1 hypothetical protein M3M38_02005 [Fructilactobacillus cliffordii]